MSNTCRVQRAYVHMYVPGRGIERGAAVEVDGEDDAEAVEAAKEGGCHIMWTAGMGWVSGVEGVLRK